MKKKKKRCYLQRNSNKIDNQLVNKMKKVRRQQNDDFKRLKSFIKCHPRIYSSKNVKSRVR